jgi:hypothetical protein
MRNLCIFNSDGVLGNDKSLVLVNPETIVRWHRAGFRLVLEFDLQGETASRKEEAV